MFILVSIAVSFLCSVFVEDWQRSRTVFVHLHFGLVGLGVDSRCGQGVNGAKRWLAFKGFNLQPSELMKLFMVLYAADYTVRKQEYSHKLTKGLFTDVGHGRCLGIVVAVGTGSWCVWCDRLYRHGDFVLGGINGIWFGGIAATLVGIFTSVILLSPWRRETDFRLPRSLQRITLWQSLSVDAFLDRLRAWWLFGVGLGASVEKLHYLPGIPTFVSGDW